MTKKEIETEILTLEKELLEQTTIMNSKKLTINGSFGKFGSIYSNLYAPDMLIQVTVTGQLALLMLIENLELNGIQVLSANTDGIVCKFKRAEEITMKNIIEDWEKITRFEMERTDYVALYSKDVNNYIAVKLNNDVKTKGCFSKSGWQKNPTNEICIDAVIALLMNKTPIEQTIKECSDVTKFLTVRTVAGGAMKKGEYIGKTIRWYYKKNDTTPIVYKTNGNQVATSQGAWPLMDITDSLPSDIDYNWYIFEAKKMYNLLFEQPVKEKKTSEKIEKTRTVKHKPQQSLF